MSDYRRGIRAQIPAGLLAIADGGLMNRAALLRLPTATFGTSRRIAAAQHFGRYWDEADIQRVTLTDADL